MELIRWPRDLTRPPIRTTHLLLPIDVWVAAATTVRSAYQPPASSTFLSERISTSQTNRLFSQNESVPAKRTGFSLRTNQYQPNEQASVYSAVRRTAPNTYTSTYDPWCWWWIRTRTARVFLVGPDDDVARMLDFHNP
jgi:hypothetical protein